MNRTEFIKIAGVSTLFSLFANEILSINPTQNRTILSIGAHPDDTEFQCAGTLALFAEKGWKIVIATMTSGQAGSAILDPKEISMIRKKESSDSAELLNGVYYCLESEDIFIMYDRETILKTIELIRKVNPTLVFTASPADYIVDHEVTSKIVRTACLAACIPNIKIKNAEPIKTVPYLYYCDPAQGKDIFGNEIESGIIVDISSTIDMKEKMLRCHKSQRDWLLEISKVDEYINMMKENSSEKGEKINRKYAEGFRQHLGFSYPTENILKSELRDLVYT